MKLDDVLQDHDYGPGDTNGNRLNDYIQSREVQRLTPDDAEVIGVDSRGIVVLGSDEETQVYYAKLSVDGELEYFSSKSMFGGDVERHVEVIADRFDKWRWLSEDAREPFTEG